MKEEMLSKLVVPAIAVLGIAGVASALIFQGTRTVRTTYGTQMVIEEKSPERKDKVVLTDAEWKRRLTPTQYKILRAKGTEAAFCGIFYDNHKTGVYHCAGCNLPLFKSDAKFDSGTGWPSFFQPVDRKNIWLKSDRSYGMNRLEVLCARCDGHLGHVFDDAPQTSTGLRFCINSDSLTFEEAKATKPAQHGDGG